MSGIVGHRGLLLNTGGANLLLDSLTGSGAAYSVRKLRTAYAGYCMRVRRSSDNTTQDIGFVSGLLDTTSLLSFCGAGSGFVVIWYDQSGSGCDITNATNAQQPSIVTSGAVNTLNSVPTVGQFDGSAMNLQTTGFPSTVLLSRTFTAAVVAKSNRTSQAAEGMVMLSRTGVADYQGGYIMERRTTNLSNGLGSGTASGNYIGKQVANSNVTALTMLHCFITPGTNTIGYYIDRTAQTLNNAYQSGSGDVNTFINSGSGNHRIVVGARGNNTTNVIDNYFQGWISEIVLWPVDQTASRTTLETSQRGYFSTP